MKKLTSLIAIILILCINSLASEKEDGKTQDDQAAAGAAKVHTFSGYVNTGKLKMPEKGDPKDMALEFFELNREQFHIKNPKDELVLAGVLSDDIITRVTLKQVYKGVAVDAGTRVFFNNRGELEHLDFTYYDIVDLSPIPQVDSATAENLALKDLGFPKDAKVVNNKKKKASTQLCIWLHQDEKFHLIWVVWVSQDYPETHDWQYYIDAHDGTVLKKADRMMRN